MNQEIIEEFVNDIEEIYGHYDIETETGKIIDKSELIEIVGDTPVEIIDLGDGDIILADNSDMTKFGKMFAYGKMK